MRSLFVIILVDVQLSDALGWLEDVDVLDRFLLFCAAAEDDEAVVREDCGGVVGAGAGNAAVDDRLEPW